MVSNIIY